MSKLNITKGSEIKSDVVGFTDEVAFRPIKGFDPVDLEFKLHDNNDMVALSFILYR